MSVCSVARAVPSNVGKGSAGISRSAPNTLLNIFFMRSSAASENSG